MASRDPNFNNARRVPLFPLLSLLCFTSIFILLSQHRKASIPSTSQSLQGFQSTVPQGSHRKIGAASCDYSDGTWIYDPNARTSRYDNTCKEIFKGWNCISGNKSNARELIKWRWKPWQCGLPQFDAIRFLQNYRDTSIGTFSLCGSFSFGLVSPERSVPRIFVGFFTLTFLCNLDAFVPTFLGFLATIMIIHHLRIFLGLFSLCPFCAVWYL